tara:strand:+ start:585 stop:1043 length:459 start_codon:yes stop_codon:yes gene_type:complete
MKKLLLMIMLSIPATSFAADWSIGYMDVDGDVGGVTLDATWGNETSPWDWSLGVLIGTKDFGEDDEFGAIIVELEPSVYVKTEYNVNESFFLKASYVDFNFDSTLGINNVGTFDVNASSTELGLGIGFNLGSVSLALDRFDDVNTFSISYNF